MIIWKCFLYFFKCIHYKRAVTDFRFIYWLSSYKNKLDCLISAKLNWSLRFCIENNGSLFSICLNFSLLLNLERSLINKYQTIPIWFYLKFMIHMIETKIVILSWLSCINWPFNITNFTRNNLNPFSRSFKYRNSISNEFLVCWLTKLKLLL